VAPRYNVAPTQTVPIVRATGRGCYALVEAGWGLVPAWSKSRARPMRRSTRAPRPSPPSLWSAPSTAVAAAASGRQLVRS